MFARNVHQGQARKYTNDPYFIHLAEVAGIVATVESNAITLAVAWLHDCVEDQHVPLSKLESEFGAQVADGVLWLSDVEPGNRAERKASCRARLAEAPSWVQTIKCADLISNSSSIFQHDPKFARVYLEEKRLLLDVLTRANRDLLDLARQYV